MILDDTYPDALLFGFLSLHSISISTSTYLISIMTNN